jgi:hypothetical protein
LWLERSARRGPAAVRAAATVSADVSGDDHDDRVTTEERLDG